MSDKMEYISFYIQGMQNSVLEIVGSGMSVIAWKKNLEFIIDNSMKTFVQYLPK